MSLSNHIDKNLRDKSSFLFRILIVFYAITIYARFQEKFQPFLLLGIIVAYLLLYKFLILKIKLFRFLRLANDFLFIYFVIYFVGINDIHTSFLIFLPLINLINHTENSIRKSFSFQLIFLTCFCYWLFSANRHDFWYLVPVAAVLLINLFTSFRIFFTSLNNRLDNVVEAYFLANNVIGKSYKILRAVISILNRDKILKIFMKVERISFFKYNQQNFSLLISSEFVYNFKISMPEFKAGYSQNISVTINGKTLPDNVGLVLDNKEDGCAYLMLIEYDREVINYFQLILLEKVFYPIFYRILNIIRLEAGIVAIRKEYINKTKDELDNIDSAANAVHFLANKLTPIINYFEMINALEKNEISDDKKGAWAKLIKDDLKRSQMNVKLIQEKMVQISLYTNNPNIIRELESVHVKSFISFVRTNFSQSCFLPFSVVVDVDEHKAKKAVSINKNALAHIFNEFIDNFNKHSEPGIEIKIWSDQNSDILALSFTNKVKDFANNHKEIGEYIHDLNTAQISEILQRKGNKGVKFVKQYLEQLKIEYSGAIVGESVILTFKFKLYESSNI
jgi:hypothetical protein